MNGKAIFIKYWYVLEPFLSTLPYKISPLPGLKKGISGSMISAVNLGIEKNLPEERRNVALELIRHVLSKEYQKYYFLNGLSLTAVKEFLYDEEVCRAAPCELIKGIQCIGYPQFIKENSEEYARKYRDYIYQFLYENKTISEITKDIMDITKIYSISLNTENTTIGLIYFILILVVSVLMILSLSFLFIKKFTPFFKFLPTDLWFITVMGSIMILWIPIANYGSLESYKCHLVVFLMSIGSTLNLCPTIYKFLIQFPEQDKRIMWFNQHKYIFLLINLLIDILLNSIAWIDSYTPKTVLVNNGQNFEVCKYNGIYSIVFILAFKLLEILLLLFLIFVEWNISNTIYDTRFSVAVIYIDILSIILIFVIHLLHINSYKVYFVTQALIAFIISITNYLFLYGFRVLLLFISNQNVEYKIILKIRENFMNCETQSISQTQTQSSNNENKSGIVSLNNKSEVSEAISKKSFISRMIEYHNTPKSNTPSMNTFTS